MTMPWTIDALLPTDQRYLSPRFRQFARFFVAGRYNFADSAELVAFVETIGLQHAKWIWQWHGTGARREVRKLVDHMVQFEQVQEMIQQNREAMDNDDGLKCLRAMQDGGFSYGKVPYVTRMALLDLRDQGLSLPKIAGMVGLTADQVKYICSGPRRKAVHVPLSSLVAG